MFAEELVALGPGVADNEINRTPAVLFLEDVAGFLRCLAPPSSADDGVAPFHIPELPP